MTAALRHASHPLVATPAPALRAVPTAHAGRITLGPVRHGLVDAAGDCRDLDTVLATARVAERDGVETVVVPPVGPDARGTHHWPATAQGLAVLLATTTVRVVVPVDATGDPAVLARFAQSATRLAGDRLVLRVSGRGAAAFASRLQEDWDGAVEVAPA